jgi:transposase
LQAQSLRLQNQTLGALPLVDHYLRTLRLRALLAEQVRHGPYADGLELLVKSLLVRPNALYRIEAWARQYDPALRPAAHLGDDALGRALDRLFDSDRASLMTALVVQASKTFDLATDQIHNDTTSIKFCGAYAHQDPRAAQLRRGFSKDHRPDLKQLIYCLSVSADGAVPVHFKTYDGNQSDDGTHLETWQCLRRLLGRADFLYVADGKLCAGPTLLQLDQQGGRFITVLPRNRVEAVSFAQEAAASRVRWQPLGSRPASRKPGRRDSFDAAAGLQQMREGFRVYWYRSSEKRRFDAQERQNRIAAALERLDRLNERRGRGPKTEPAIRRAADNVLARFRLQGLIRFQIDLRQEEQFVQTTRGKATAQTTYKRRTRTIPTLRAQLDAAAVDAAQTMDGVFPLVTNTDLPAWQVLQKYKYQPRLEKRHFLGKSVLEISPVFLKKNSRIEALMFLCFVAQMVAALMERTLRKNMARRKIKAIPILPEGRDSKTPSYAQILDTFALQTKHYLYENDHLIQTFIDPLADLQTSVLDLLEIAPAVYQ